MKIRNLEVEDMESLSKLYYQFWNENSDVIKMENKFSDLQSNDAYIFLCAVEANLLVGSVMGIVCEELYGDCKPFLVIENMIVDCKYRKKGIGKMLIEQLEKQAKAKGCSQIILVTETNRHDACEFYESMGFHPTVNKGYKKKL
jgi:Predicted acetyltransferase